MEQRHGDRDRRDGHSHPARKAVGGALFLLDIFLGLAELFFGNDLRFGARLDVFRHCPLAWKRCDPAL
jgi:hypothetical protein